MVFCIICYCSLGAQFDIVLPLFIFSIDWVFPLFSTLLPLFLWNQQFNGKYLNKIYKVFDLVRIFLPSPILVKTLQTSDGLCGFPGFHCCLVCVQTDKTLVLRYSCPCMLCQLASIVCVFHSDVFLGACTLLFSFCCFCFCFGEGRCSGKQNSLTPILLLLFLLQHLESASLPARSL